MVIVFLSLAIGYLVGFVSCYIWQSALQKKLQQDLSAMKAAAVKNANQP